MGVLKSVLLLIAGIAIGYVLQILFEKLGKVKLDFVLFDKSYTLLQYLAEIVYIAAVFSAPLSGNVPVSILILAVYAYSLYGSYGIEKVKFNKEDKVTSKWFKMYP